MKIDVDNLVELYKYCAINRISPYMVTFKNVVVIDDIEFVKLTSKEKLEYINEKIKFDEDIQNRIESNNNADNIYIAPF